MTTLLETGGEPRLPAWVDTVPDIPGAGGDIVRITLRTGEAISVEDGILVRERFLALTGGAGVRVLLQITGVEWVSRGAFQLFSDAATITACAILGGTPVDRVIAHGRRGLPPPQCPSRYFSDEQEALRWLRDFAPNNDPNVRTFGDAEAPDPARSAFE